MKVAAVQFAPVWEDREASFRKVEPLARQAADRGAELLVLPEMFSTGFSMNPALTAEAPDGPTASFLRELARTHGFAVIGGLVLRTDDGSGRGRNVALAVDHRGEDLALYDKTYLIALMDEHVHHVAGDGPRPFRLDGVGMACFVCYDLRFPELFRAAADASQVMVVIASWPAARQRHWDLLLAARAVENQCFVIGVNRVGEGGGYAYTGGTVIRDPLGERLAHGGDAAGLVEAEIDRGMVGEVRGRFPFLKDRKNLG